MSGINGLRVLLVEDQSLVAMATEHILGEMGCAVVGYAANLSHAYRLLNGGAFDVAVLDINLGQGQTIYDFAEELIARGVPFCFLTAYRNEDVKPRFAGVPIVAKPLVPSRLAEALLELVPKR